MWNKIGTLILAIGIFIGVEQLTRLKTHGLRLTKTQFDCVEGASATFSPGMLPDNLLDQPFTFLGSGAQCYAFVSADNTLVLKLFKHYHMGALLKKSNCRIYLRSRVKIRFFQQRLTWAYRPVF